MGANELLGSTEPAPWWVKVFGAAVVVMLAIRGFVR